MKRLLQYSALITSLAGCSSDNDKAGAYDQSNYVSPEQQAEDRANELRERLGERYGQEAARYALQIFENGRRIREHPQKRPQIDGLEKRIRGQFPLITPPRLFGFIDEPREAENLAQLYQARARVLEKSRKDHIELPMSFIIAALCNEGHSLDVDRNSSATGGFANYGLDTFGSEFTKIAARGYLPDSFRNRFRTSEHFNEQHRRVTSANFERKEDAFEAFVATLAHRQYLFQEDLGRNGINVEAIPREQILFFTYKYYNGGPNSIERLLQRKSAQALDAFYQRTITIGSTGNAYVVLAGHLWLEQSGATDPHPEGKYWWSRE
ncbi:hypothetical protein HYU22_00875 [Candidatus Woesearchaeota archaeon]|nr:hypothetical protein [Candidatus Woesearchaeota archaeon]